MAIAFVQTIGPTGYENGDSGNAEATLTLPNVTAGSLLVAVVHNLRYSYSSGNGVTGVTFGGNAGTLAIRQQYRESVTNHLHETTIWYYPNSGSGNKAVVIDFVVEDDANKFSWSAHEFSGIATTSPLDKTTGNTAGDNTSSLNTGTTATLAQANELVIAGIASKWNYSLNGDNSDPSTPPSGYTLLAGDVEGNQYGMLSFQTVYKTVASTSGVVASWTKVSQSDNGSVAALATFKEATASLKRIEVTGFDSSINSDSGITAYVWDGAPTSYYAQTWTGITAESSGGIVYLPNYTGTVAVDGTVNVVLYQPAGSYGAVGIVSGVVKNY